MSMNRRLKKRFEKPRPMSSISIRMPEDVLENLKEVSTALGFSGYQPLIRFYIGQSLRKDLARIEGAGEQVIDKYKTLVDDYYRTLATKSSSSP